jgi:hypothetical protein
MLAGVPSSPKAGCQKMLFHKKTTIVQRMQLASTVQYVWRTSRGGSYLVDNDYLVDENTNLENNFVTEKGSLVNDSEIFPSRWKAYLVDNLHDESHGVVVTWADALRHVVHVPSTDRR